jgi:hypothetical protein
MDGIHQAGASLRAIEIDCGERCVFITDDGQEHGIVLISSDAKVYSSTLADTHQPQFGARTVCQMHVVLQIDGHQVELVRYVGNDKSFYQPWELFGLRLWFDANQDLFDHLLENHGACKPRKRARFAIQDARRRICPVLLHPWCPLPEGGLRIEQCYNGDDCWMGPYFGGVAHGGLDINHPAGTTLYAPIAFDEQGFYQTLAGGHNNNRWGGVKTWADGARWCLQSAHLIRLLVPEHQPLAAGTAYAESAGVLTGDHEHSHFMFSVTNPGEAEPVLLDPWILFWQMYQDRRLLSC